MTASKSHPDPISASRRRPLVRLGAAVAAMALFGATLTGCSWRGPGQSDIETWLLKKKPDDANITGINIKKYECHLMEHGQAHQCIVAYKYVYKDGAEPKDAPTLNHELGFMKTDDGIWVMTFNRPVKDLGSDRP